MGNVEIFVVILAFLLGTLGAGLVIYVTAISKISKLFTIIDGLKTQLTLRNDALLKEMDNKQIQINNLKEKTAKHDGEIEEIKIEIARM